MGKKWAKNIHYIKSCSHDPSVFAQIVLGVM